jgi:hypothetical protein
LYFKDEVGAWTEIPRLNESSRLLPIFQAIHSASEANPNACKRPGFGSGTVSRHFAVAVQQSQRDDDRESGYAVLI